MRDRPRVSEKLFKSSESVQRLDWPDYKSMDSRAEGWASGREVLIRSDGAEASAMVKPGWQESFLGTGGEACLGRLTVHARSAVVTPHESPSFVSFLHVACRTMVSFCPVYSKEIITGPQLQILACPRGQWWAGIVQGLV